MIQGKRRQTPYTLLNESEWLNGTRVCSSGVCYTKACLEPLFIVCGIVLDVIQIKLALTDASDHRVIYTLSKNCSSMFRQIERSLKMGLLKVHVTNVWKLKVTMQA